MSVDEETKQKIEEQKIRLAVRRDLAGLRQTQEKGAIISFFATLLGLFSILLCIIVFFVTFFMFCMVYKCRY